MTDTAIKRVTVFVSPEVAQALRVAAAHAGTGLSQVVSRLVQEHLLPPTGRGTPRAPKAGGSDRAARSGGGAPARVNRRP